MNTKLAGWRKQIDTIDKRILTSLAKRMKIAGKIGKFKKNQKISAIDKKRWEQVLKSNIKNGKSLGLSKGFVVNLLSLIHKHSIEIQNEQI